MITVLFIVQIVLAIALVISVLIQRSDQDGFGLGSGSGAGLLSGRTKANLLTRTTAILATLFMLNSIMLTVLSSRGESNSLIDKIEQMSNPAPVQEEAPAAPLVPREGESSTSTVPTPMETAPAEEAPVTEAPAAETPAVPADEAPATTEPTEVPKAQ